MASQNRSESVKESKRKDRLSNPERTQRIRRKSFLKNKDEINHRRRQQYVSDPSIKVACSLRSRLCRAIQSRTISSEELLGCTYKELVIHLESQFEDGMTWGNHGEWHIDHIIPLAAFVLTNSEELEIAAHFTNLQPLWASANLSKGARLDDLSSSL